MTKYALIARDAVKHDPANPFIVKVKLSSDFRRWPHRESYDRYPTRAAAKTAAEQAGAVVVTRWADATLTPEEEQAQYQH